MGNSSLNKAKSAKDDEFYTQLCDVEKEMMNYPDAFHGKVVYCNCDDPEWSAFWRYFSLNFDRLGLKRLVSTHYSPDGGAYRLDMVSQGQQILPIPLEGDGDFRSPECLALLDEVDVVVTNPPFSLFREFVSTLMEHGKGFIVLGNMNAITYAEVFPHILAGRMWLGCCNGAKTYRRPDGGESKLGNTIWFTNMEHRHRHEPAVLYRRFDPQAYPRYDNYDAVEVSKAADIPMDYDGVMGVPISFLDKLCPEQFEIVDASGYRTDGKGGSMCPAPSGSSSGAANCPVLDGRRIYKRILIRRRPE